MTIMSALVLKHMLINHNLEENNHEYTVLTQRSGFGHACNEWKMSQPLYINAAWGKILNQYFTLHHVYIYIQFELHQTGNTIDHTCSNEKQQQWPPKNNYKQMRINLKDETVPNNCQCRARDAHSQSILALHLEEGKYFWLQTHITVYIIDFFLLHLIEISKLILWDVFVFPRRSYGNQL